MFGRKLLASSALVMLLLTATAVQAAPQVTTTFIARWSSGSPGDMIVEVGQIAVTEAANGAVTLAFDFTRTIACPALPGASTIERWQATDAPATMSVKNNLSSATVTANIVGGASVTSTCPGVDNTTGDVGAVTIEAVATTRTLRERTIDRVRILTRTVEAAVSLGSWSFVTTGEIEKRIG